MAENRSSDNVVMPDITEVSEADPLAAAAEHDAERSDGGQVLARGVKSTRLSSDSDGVITVPVSLPVGTLITGTTFNVITSDQLPMLCVDNGFISGGPVSEDIKPTHVVIQNPSSPARSAHEDAGPPSAPAAQRAANARSWAETANMPILPVRCKNISAELHKQRFGSGGRGRCIKYGMDWYTPSEFEALCGRASSKDWKRSIRFGGRSIQALIDVGILTPHATSCTCGACCDDQSAMGPVRLFTPVKRKRKVHQDSDEKKVKVKQEQVSIGESDVDNIHQTSNNSHSKEAWQTIADGLDGNTDYQLLDNPDVNADHAGERGCGSRAARGVSTAGLFPSANGQHRRSRARAGCVSTAREPRPRPPPANADSVRVVRSACHLSGVMKRLDDIGQTLVRLAGELKQCAEEVRAVSARHIERIEQERATALLAASVDADHADVSLQNVDDADSKKCANCNREASAECSLCRRTPYCSTYCQKKDWATHQIECLRIVPAVPAVHTVHGDAQHHQSIMLIVESQHQ